MRTLNWVGIAVALAILAVPLTAGAIRINEIRIDNPGVDTDEYFELFGNPAEPLDGLAYLVIGDGAMGSGTIESVVDLTNKNLEDDGFLAVHNQSTTGTCFGYDEEESLNFEDEDNVTHMLVVGFSGSNGDDLDTDDDGILDVEPWFGVVDCVALIADVVGGDLIYCEHQVGPDDIFPPGHVLRCGLWVIGDFEACIHDTPGQANDVACDVPNESKTWGVLKSRYK